MTESSANPSASEYGVDLYWLPLGAGGHSVRLNGIAYEALIARAQHRRDGYIPDVAEAVETPSDRALTQRPHGAFSTWCPRFPRPCGGRDELGKGDMWNSNSLIAWLLVRSGIGADAVRPPSGGRAPGWQAGLVVADRQLQR